MKLYLKFNNKNIFKKRELKDEEKKYIGRVMV